MTTVTKVMQYKSDEGKSGCAMSQSIAVASPNFSFKWVRRN